MPGGCCCSTRSGPRRPAPHERGLPGKPRGRVKLPVLLAVLLLEIGCILHGLTRPAVVGETVPPPPAAPRVASPERAPVGIEAMLGRPLFTPGRALPGPGTLAPVPMAVPPRLAGVIVAEQRGRAIFAGPDGKSIVLGEGGRLGLFTVVAVRPDGVELAGPPGIRTLRPSSDAALRPQPAGKPPVLALIDPDRREAETESDQ